MHKFPCRIGLRSAALATLILIAGLPACSNKRTVDPSDQEMSTYVSLVLPRKIEIMRYITQPTSFSGTDPDGVTAIVEAYDAQGDKTKIVGMLVFELVQYRLSQGDRMGEQVAVWPVALESEEAMKMYWDRLTRSYKFPLKLENGRLSHGRYALNVSLVMPDGERVMDSYEMTFEPGQPQTRPAENKEVNK